MVEILIVVVILGILGTVVMFAVRGITDRGERSACAGDARTLSIAADAWMAQESLDEVPALGASDDRYELYLVDVGMIRQVSTYWDLHADGTVTSTGDPCP
jgi:type II secretory pathway pseudopilin PulG